MRAVAALALVVSVVIACGGGASSPVQVSPAVTTAPTTAPGAATQTPQPYYEGY